MALLLEAITEGQSALSAFFAELGYFGPFLVLVACGFGFPLPEEVTMLGAGFLVYEGEVEALPVVGVCWAATLIGDSVPYWVGRRFGRSALRIGPVARVLHPERMGSIERRFERNGSWAVFACRFVPGLRLPAWFTAGTLGMPYLRFIAIDGLGAMIMTPLFVLLGYTSGEKIAQLEQRVENLHQILGFVAMSLVAILLARYAFKGGGDGGPGGPEEAAAPAPGPDTDDEPDGDRP